MAIRPFRIPSRTEAAAPPPDSRMSDAVRYFSQRIQDLDRRTNEAVVEVQSRVPAQQTPMAQIGYDPTTNTYVIGSERFDADDLSMIHALADLPDLPMRPLAPGLQATTLADVQRRRQAIRDDARIGFSPMDRVVGGAEALGNIVPGVASLFGRTAENPLEGMREDWRRDNLPLAVQEGRTHRPTQSVTGLMNAFGQAIETGVPVLIAAGLGTKLGGPGAGIAAGAAVGGGMAAGSQAEAAAERVQAALLQATPQELAANPEYMRLRRAGNDHEASVGELVRRARTTAGRTGAVVGGLGGALAGPALGFAARGLGIGGKTTDDVIGDAMLRALRGRTADGAVRTGFAATSRAVGGAAGVGGLVEGSQEFLETDLSQGLADVSAGLSDRYVFNRHGTIDDFVGGFVGGAPLGALGGFRLPPRGTADPSLNAAAAGAVNPAPAPEPAPATPDTAPPAPRGMVRDMFTGLATSPEDVGDPRADAVAEAEAIADTIRRLDAFTAQATDPEQATQAAELRAQLVTELEQLRARIGPTEREFDPNQPQMFLRPQGPSAPVRRGEVGDLFGAPARAPAAETEPTPPVQEIDPNQRDMFEQRPGQVADLFNRAPPRAPAPAAETEPTPPVQEIDPNQRALQESVQPDQGPPARRRLQADLQAYRRTASEVSPGLLVDRQVEDARELARLRTEATHVQGVLDDYARLQRNGVSVPRARVAHFKAHLQRINDRIAELAPTPVADAVAPAPAPPVAPAPAPTVAPAGRRRVPGVPPAPAPAPVVDAVAPAPAPTVAPAGRRRVPGVPPAPAPTVAPAPAPTVAPAPAPTVAPAGRRRVPGVPPAPTEPVEAPVRLTVAPGRPPAERLAVIDEMLAVEQRKLQRRELGRSERLQIEEQVAQLERERQVALAEIETAGRGPAREGLPRPADRHDGPEREQGSPAPQTPSEETTEVLTREEANHRAMMDLQEALLAEARDDAPVIDDAIAPDAVAPVVSVTGAEAPVLRAANTQIELEGDTPAMSGAPATIIERLKQRLENLSRLLNCVLK